MGPESSGQKTEEMVKKSRRSEEQKRRKVSGMAEG